MQTEVKVVYTMNDKSVHELMFNDIREAFSFKGALTHFIRRAIVTDFKIIKLIHDNSGVIAI